MSNFTGLLIRKIRQYRLHEKTPSQTASKVNWKQIILVAEHGMLSEKMARNFLYLVEKDIEMLRDHPDFLHRLPSEQQFHNNLRPHARLGCLSDDRDIEFGTRFDQPTFISCSGLTGFGKTNALRVLMSRIYEYNRMYPQKAISVIAFNRKGTDFADMPRRFGWKHYHVFQSLRMSLENPPGMPAVVWINIIASLFCARAQLKFSWTTLVAVIKTLLGLLNPKPAQRLIWPDFQLILDFLNMLPDRVFSTKAEYTRALKQRLEAICFSTSDTFKAFQGFQTEQLIANRESAVITMPNIEPGWVRQFVTDVIIDQVLKARMQQFQTEGRLRVLFVIEEADSDVDAELEKLFSDGMSPVSELFKKGRGFSVGGCISVSSLKHISSLIKENTTTHLMFKPNDHIAASIAAETLMLPEMGELTANHLQVGQCIAKQIGPWPHAVKVDIDHNPAGAPCTDYNSHEFMPSVKITELPSVMQFIRQIRDKGKSSKTTTKKDLIAEKSKKILQLAADNPYVPVKYLFDKLGKIHHKTQKAIRKYIEKKHWARFEEPRIGRTNLLLIELTPKGYKAVNKPLPSANKGRGSITHRHFAHFIKQHFENLGFKSIIEWPVPGSGHPVDVAVKTGGHWDVFEISVSATENVVSHINAGLSCEKIKTLTLVTGTGKQLNKLKKKLEGELVVMKFANRLKFDVIGNYMKRSK